jgi:hypothetical protein
VRDLFALLKERILSGAMGSVRGYIFIRGGDHGLSRHFAFTTTALSGFLARRKSSPASPLRRGFQFAHNCDPKQQTKYFGKHPSARHRLQRDLALLRRQNARSTRSVMLGGGQTAGIHGRGAARKVRVQQNKGAPANGYAGAKYAVVAHCCSEPGAIVGGG